MNTKDFINLPPDESQSFGDWSASIHWRAERDPNAAGEWLGKCAVELAYKDKKMISTTP